MIKIYYLIQITLVDWTQPIIIFHWTHENFLLNQTAGFCVDQEILGYDRIVFVIEKGDN